MPGSPTRARARVNGRCAAGSPSSRYPRRSFLRIHSCATLRVSPKYSRPRADASRCN